MAYEHVWNTSFEASPATSDQASEGALRIRNLKEAIRERMQEGHYWDPAGTDADHGKHTTPTFKDAVTDPAAPVTANEVKLYNKSGRLYYITQTSDKHELQRSPIPSGTKMLFKQNAAPSGWTFVAEDNDRVLLNTKTVSEGGALGGDWWISGLVVGGHVLTEAELPFLHACFGVDHGAGNQSVVSCSSNVTVVPGGLPLGDILEFYGGAHERDKVDIHFGGNTSHTHSISHDGAWRPAYAKVITCTKD